MRKFIHILLITIILIITGCNKQKEVYELLLYLNNQTSDTIKVKLYSVNENNIDEYLLVPDSNQSFFYSTLYAQPNEIILANYKKIELAFKDTTQIITYESDTSNNLFKNSRWKLFNKIESDIITNFTSKIVYEYQCVFYIYDINKKRHGHSTNEQTPAPESRRTYSLHH
jgi:hypothetical protein